MSSAQHKPCLDCGRNIEDWQEVRDFGPGQHCVELLNSYKCEMNIKECEFNSWTYVPRFNGEFYLTMDQI